MKKILAAIIILAALTGISHANIVYTTSGGDLGVIRIGSITSIDSPALTYRGVGSYPLAGSYTVGTNSYIMVVDRASDNESGDTALIFSSSNLTSPAESVTLHGVYNTKTFAGSYNGRSLFVASQGNDSIVAFSAYSVDVPVNSYTCINESEDTEYEPELVDMSVGVSYIYALFRTAPNKLEVFKFDGQLKEGVESFSRRTVRNDATNIYYLSSNNFAIGAEREISIVNSTTMYGLVSTDYPVKSICRDKDERLYYIEQSESGDVNLYHYTSDGFMLIDSFQSDSDCQLLKDTDYNILAVMTEDSIYLYNMEEDELIASFNSSSLGGIPLNITASRAEYDDGSTSNSNCNVSGAGAIMISVLGLGLTRRKR